MIESVRPIPILGPDAFRSVAGSQRQTGRPLATGTQMR